MQVTSTKPFQPVELTLTLETQDEANALHGVLNNSKVAGTLRSGGLDPEAIRERIPESSTADSYRYTQMVNGFAFPSYTGSYLRGL